MSSSPSTGPSQAGRRTPPSAPSTTNYPSKRRSILNLLKNFWVSRLSLLGVVLPGRILFSDRRFIRKRGLGLSGILLPIYLVVPKLQVMLIQDSLGFSVRWERKLAIRQLHRVHRRDWGKEFHGIIFHYRYSYLFIQSRVINCTSDVYIT